MRQSPGVTHRGISRPVVVIAVLLVSLSVLVWVFRESPEKRMLQQADDALRQKDAERAMELALAVLETKPTDASALATAGTASLRLNRPQQALEYYSAIVHDGNASTSKALMQAGMTALRLYRSGEAETFFLKVLNGEPGHHSARKMLVRLMRLAGRSWAARPHIQKLMAQGQFDRFHLFLLAETELPVLGDQDNALLAEIRSKDPLADLSSAKRLVAVLGQNEEARPLLESLVSRHPELAEAQYLLGLVYLRTGAFPQMQSWHAALPASTDFHPGIWHLRGLWARRSGHKEAAARCFYEALRRGADHQAANHQLAATLTELGREEDAEPFARRSRQLARLKYLAQDSMVDLRKIEEMTQLLEELGRYWEAWGWAHVTIQDGAPGKETWAAKLIPDMKPLVNPRLPLVADDFNPALALSLTEYKPPDWTSREFGAEELQPSGAGQASVSFANWASEAGIDFQYYNAADPSKAWMFEFSGGGMAVLDFDVDGWPDIQLTQGCAWPPDESSAAHHDRLYRNRGDGTFDDVSNPSRLACTLFGQGAAVGDVNSDGFPDLYVANLGENRLYFNNGDGTFTDVTALSGLEGDVWTLSCLVADLNGDSLPDLYDVNYLGGDVLERVCSNGKGFVQCGPTDFPGEQDQMYLNLGDGTFENVTEEAGFLFAEGRGMGVVAADFDGSGRLSLFISNDTTANAFFINETENAGDRPAFVERGVVSGVAYDAAGHASSCMGIAVDDTQQDGLLDLFVTNFQREANSFYRQRDRLYFQDEVDNARLAQPGFRLEGWGTQFLDVDNDGFSDLVVANGHLDNYPHTTDVLHLMPTQVFLSQRDHTYVELNRTELGAYFEGDYLGRAVARLDWNCDGREDFGVTHANVSFALLTNETVDAGHSLSVRLRGVQSSREAIGATVTVRFGERSLTKQLTAGDGYTASNQRQLIFGLGEAEQVDELIVKWPAGAVETYTDLTADQKLLLIEGDSSYHAINPLGI